MNKYKNLILNTLIFGLGTFSSKVLVFLLMPLYTRVLTSADYGTVDLIMQTGNLLVPLVMMGISNAVIRFGLDKSINKNDVFTTALLSVGGGFAALLVFYPLIMRIPGLGEYALLIYAFVLMSCLRSICSNFVRAKQYVRLYAFDGFLSTLMTVTFNILFLVVFKMGITGYVLATVLADFLSSVFLFLVANLKQYIDIKGLNRSVAKQMLRYAIPMIPTTIFWWITNVSDRFLVTYMISEAANGLYAISYKIPTLIMLVSGIFIEAWQMSAVTENDKPYREVFFTRVSYVYQSLIFMGASMLIPFSKVIIRILTSEEFYPSWQYIPLLVLATCFSCLTSFLGSVYMVEKKSGTMLWTTILGAGINLALNFLLIPVYGVNGAAFATFFSYFVVFLVRAFHTRRFIKIRWNVPKFIINFVLIGAQCFIMIGEVPLWILWESLLLATMLILNARVILQNVLTIIRQKG